MRSALIQAFLPAGALSAALHSVRSGETSESPVRREQGGLAPGQRLPGYVTSSNWTSDELFGLDLDSHPDIFKPAYDADPAATEYGLKMRDVEPAHLQARDNVETTLKLSEARIDWGCDGNIQAPLENAIAALCSDGLCSHADEYIHPVDWTDGGAIATHNLVFKVQGRYNGNVRHHLIDAVKATSTEDTWSVHDVSWQVGGVTGTELGGWCAMTQFSKGISINRDDGNRDSDWLDITVELRPTDGMCSPLPSFHST